MIAPLRPADPLQVWTVSDLLAWTEAHFRRLSSPTPRLDAEVLLAHALGSTRIDLYTGYHKVVEPDERERFRSFVERRGRGEPVAYITGTREFHSLRFEVTPAVLIPRPETEHLVDGAVERLSGMGAAKVLDLGTGSGNIAVSVTVRIPTARVTAADLSPGALEVARRNAARHGVEERIEFLLGDLFAPLRTREPPLPFDAILSNPPYIPPELYAGLSRDVRDFEPESALLDCRGGPGGGGLGFHRAIAREAWEFLLPGGLLGLEVGAGQAPAVVELLRAAGFERVETTSDYGGIVRVVWANRPNRPNGAP